MIKIAEISNWEIGDKNESYELYHNQNEVWWSYSNNSTSWCVKREDLTWSDIALSDYDDVLRDFIEDYCESIIEDEDIRLEYLASLT